MMTRVFQIARVLLGSTVDRIDAFDAEGHTLRLEVPTGEAQTASEGRVLVLQWSLHDLPAALVPEAAQVAQVAPEMTTPPATTPAFESTGRSVDEDFIQLMGRGNRGASASSSGAPSTGAAVRGTDRDIQDEFNVLLGSARAKGRE